MSEAVSENHPPAGPTKKAKLSQPQLKFTLNKSNVEHLDKLREHWETGNTVTERNGNVVLCKDPFLHAEVSDFIAQTEAREVEQLREQLSKVQFVEKSSDLFKFKQSNDLTDVPVEDIQFLREFFETTVLDFITRVTGLPLDGKVDMFLSEYVKTDFLLCHDDELESRRIAFILYLSEEWNSDYGGSLDLFASSDQTEPLQIVKSITPAFNKFVFFNVTSTSFHQVAEVVADNVKRLAISGWFYGEPLPRPTLNFVAPESYSLMDNLSTNQNLAFNEFFTEEYLCPTNYPAINASLEEYSIAKLKFLIRSRPYDSLLKALEAQDSQIHWVDKGPANQCSYQTPNSPLVPIPVNEFPPTLCNFLEMIFSEGVFRFVEQVTEFRIRDEDCRITPALRRFQHKSYILLKTPDGEQGVTNENEADEHDEGEAWESEDEYDETSIQAISSRNFEMDIGVVTSLTAMARKNGIVHNVSSSDEDVEEYIDEEYTDDIEREIDIIYYFGDFSWDETFGGQTVYADSTGQQLLTVTPEPNTMAIVIREKTVIPYVSYINCLAGKERFHTLTFTLSQFKDLV